MSTRISSYTQKRSVMGQRRTFDRAPRALPRDSYVLNIHGAADALNTHPSFGLELIPRPAPHEIDLTTSEPVYEWEAPSQDAAGATTGERFQELRDEWKLDTEFVTSAEERFMHFAYQRIIGLGREGLPFILRELRDYPAHWFWALAAIAGEDHGAGAESFDEARELWLSWGAQEGYLI
jgi:hypothetical protein